MVCQGEGKASVNVTLRVMVVFGFVWPLLPPYHLKQMPDQLSIILHGGPDIIIIEYLVIGYFVAGSDDEESPLFRGHVFDKWGPDCECFALLLVFEL